MYFQSLQILRGFSAEQIIFSSDDKCKTKLRLEMAEQLLSDTNYIKMKLQNKDYQLDILQENRNCQMILNVRDSKWTRAMQLMQKDPLSALDIIITLLAVQNSLDKSVVN